MKSYVQIETSENGNDYIKWIPSIEYQLICEDLLKHLNKRKEFDIYGSAFILILVAYFEANLNDWLIIDTFNKHGPLNYEKIVNGYVSLSLKYKYRVAVSVMTDNAFQINDDCDITKHLDELIEVRNKLVHPKPRFYSKTTKHKCKPKKQRAQDHPLHTIEKAHCNRYFDAIKKLNELFFMQYDKGEINENEFIKEIPPVMYR